MKDQFGSTANPGAPTGETAMPAAATDSKTENVQRIATFNWFGLQAGAPASRAHGYHSLAFLVLSLALYGLLSLCRGVFEPVLPILPLAWLCGFVFLLWSAYQGHPRMFPLVRTIAERMACVKVEASVTKAD